MGRWRRLFVKSLASGRSVAGILDGDSAEFRNLRDAMKGAHGSLVLGVGFNRRVKTWTPEE